MKQKDNKISMLFLIMSVLFCVCLIMANILATKQINVFGINVTGGLLIFPVSYIINDCVCEVWGYKKIRMLIWLGFAMNFFFVTICALCDMIPGAEYWTNNDGFHAIFGLAPRITVASFLAFLTGSFVNAYVMSKMKISSKGKHFSFRAVLSTLFGETADSLIFFPVAFYGVIPLSALPVLMFWQIILKTLYEIVVLPLTIYVVSRVKRIEGEDVYDEHISYNILNLKDMTYGKQ